MNKSHEKIFIFTQTFTKIKLTDLQLFQQQKVEPKQMIHPMIDHIENVTHTKKLHFLQKLSRTNLSVI